MNQVFLDIKNNKFSNIELLTILELTIHKLNVKSISDMARSESKKPNGIRSSNCYRKIQVGSIKLCTNKLRDLDLPF